MQVNYVTTSMNKSRSKAVKRAFKKTPEKKEKPKLQKIEREAKSKKIREKKAKNILEKKVRRVCKPSKNRNDYEVLLESPASNSFLCKMAANSLDIDVKKKLKHHLKIKNVDLDGEFNIGLIIGSSGSGKTTLAKKIFGDECFKTLLKQDVPIIDQFPEGMEYGDVSSYLSGVGLTSVPCWIRPVYTLSNGQKSRAEAALILGHSSNDIRCIDEWTSVVDRTVAKVMSHCVQKRIRQFDKKLILLSCHYDVAEWLDPDWIIDCNKQTFIDRRSLRPEQRDRKEKLTFEIREVESKTWKSFSKYHYLSDKFPGGKCFYYGLFERQNQIGFMCLANYCPIRRGTVPIYHSNRVVIHPDYAGMGLGIKLINNVCRHFKNRFDHPVNIWAAFSSLPLYKARVNDPLWELKSIKRPIGSRDAGGEKLLRKSGFRRDVCFFSFKYVGP